MQLDELLGAGFNLDDIAGEDEFMCLPAGWYAVEIKEVDVKTTKSGTGQYLKLRMDVATGDYAGRVIFTNLNVRNTNEVAEKIGRQQLGALCRAAGIPQLQDTDQLIGGTMEVKLSVDKDEQYGDNDGNVNNVKKFRSINSSEAPTPGTATKSPETAAGGSKPPWAK